MNRISNYLPLIQRINIVFSVVFGGPGSKQSLLSRVEFPPMRRFVFERATFSKLRV